MPFVLILLALICAYFVWRGLRPPNVSGPVPQGRIAGRSKCNWEATGNDTVSFGEYYCKTCKTIAYAQGGKPPKECKKHLSGSL